MDFPRIEEFMSHCGVFLDAKDGREQLADLLEWFMARPMFLGECRLAYADIGRRVYIDPSTGITLAPYPYHGPQVRRPHDHCGSWEIYGQAEGVTYMMDAEVISLPTATKPALCQPIACRTIQTGQAIVADEECIHAPWRPGAGMLVRVEGVSFEGKRRIAYDWA